MSRQGKHKENKTLLGAYVTHDVKALVIMTADRLGITITDIILNGLYAEARRAQLIDSNNKIKPEYLSAFEALKEMCEIQRMERKQK
jgi:hypothetical protein